MEPEIIRGFLGRRNVIAVVGVNRNPEKYGYQVYMDLKEAGYKVYPINPNVKEVLGDKCYPDLRSLPEKPDVVNLVVPPKVSEEVVKTCKEIGVTKVWMQPGSESGEAVRFCHESGIEVIHGVCIMIQHRKIDI